MAVLILAELNGNDLSEDATAKAISAAKVLGDVHVLCASSNCSGAATSAAKLNGVSKVLCVDKCDYKFSFCKKIILNNIN